MTGKKFIRNAILMIIGAIGGLVFLIYVTVKTKATSLNQYEPFKAWIGETVVLKREAAVFKEKLRSNENGRYPCTLLDSLHPKWRYVQVSKAIGDLEEIGKLPAGTVLKLECTIQYTNGVSGSSYPTIFGTITENGNTYKIGYQWGSREIGKCVADTDKCWPFNQAPWQAERDTTFYALQTATLW